MWTYIYFFYSARELRTCNNLQMPNSRQFCWKRCWKSSNYLKWTSWAILDLSSNPKRTDMSSDQNLSLKWLLWGIINGKTIFICPSSYAGGYKNAEVDTHICNEVTFFILPWIILYLKTFLIEASILLFASKDIMNTNYGKNLIKRIW